MNLQQIIRDFWVDVAAQNADKMRIYFTDNAIINWHNSNESFHLEEYIKANCEYPGDWSVEVERLEQKENLIISVARLQIVGTDTVFRVTSFFEFRDNKIAALDEYWGDEGLAPQWRRDMQLGRKIRE
jgi:hypothetical protein